jgi:hypothetical protein
MERHTGLGRITQDTPTTLGRVGTGIRRIIHGGTIHVTTRDASRRSLLQSDLVTLSNLAFQLLPPDFTALSKRNVERLGTNYFVIHLGNGLGGLIGRRKTDEAKPFRCPLLIAHNLATCNCTEGLEFSTKLLVIDIILEVFDVKVDTLILAHLLLFRCFVCLPQFIFALGLLLSSRNKKFSALIIGIV